jgi:hypothetical protein
MSTDGLLEVSFVAWGNAVALLALLVTIVSGYLVTAFVVGDKLLRSQVAIITALYLLLSTFVLWGTRNMIDRAADFEDVAYGLASGDLAQFTSKENVGLAIVAIFAICIIASLKFMWDVRHPKTE